MQKSPMTVRGAQLLRDELKERKTVMRSKITEDIAEARAHGDLKENAEYHAAREQQSFNEGRIQEVEGKLGAAEIIDVTKLNPNGKVVFGATVTLLDINSEEEVTYQIVGEDESNIKENRISVTSPIARALIGKVAEDEVEVQAPGGTIDYEILDVKYV